MPISPCLWLTRTQPGADRLAVQVRAAGFDAFVAPVLAIRSLPMTKPMPPADLIVVLSEQVVASADAVIWSTWVTAATQVLAVGPQTAKALAVVGIRAQVPQTQSSEGLLDELLPSTRVAGQRVLILRGRSGRELVRETLLKRGALVTEVDVYERISVTTLALDVPRISAIVASSGDGLKAADALWRDAGGSLEIPVFVPSDRVHKIAQGIGLRNAYNCGGADAESVILAVKQQFSDTTRAGAVPMRDPDVT